MALRKKEKTSSSVSDKKSPSTVQNKMKNENNKATIKSLPEKPKIFIGRRIVICILALSFALLHRYHVSALFENDRHFSHLSTLEREMTFRSEMGMYYSYYKTIIEAPSFIEGFWRITHDNLTEYPSVINTLERFNLFPEVILGSLYRIFDSFCDKFGIVGKQCWEIERGNGLSPVYSCEGIRQPEYFYLEAVWFCAGLTAAAIFLYGTFLSDSIFGGIISIMCFFFNHGECTRVQWTPPLRESFAYPFCLFQMLHVSRCLHENKYTTDDTIRERKHAIQFMKLVLTTYMCLIMWQFSQFLLATQVIAVLLLFMLGLASKFSVSVIIQGLMMGTFLAWLFMFGNEMLVTSLLSCLLLSASVMLMFIFPLPFPNHPSLFKNIWTTIFTFAFAIVLKTRALTTNDDVHIMNILRSKISSFKDFHTLLYTCSAEFDFLGWEPVMKLTKTFLLPIVLLISIVLFIHCIVSPLKAHAIDPDVVYNILQLAAFTVMAAMIMRLKLFFTPHLCIVASLIASRKYFKILEPRYHFAFLVLLLGCMKYGITNLIEQHYILGEYSNVALEELLGWIIDHTPPTAVFAGPMPVTAAILLSTRRPIVNHPHYEDAGLRERTKRVYSAFSRKPPEDVFKIISSLEVDYLVLSEGWCYGQNRPGCSMTDLWDVEDSENRDRPPTCEQLLLGNFPFHLAYSNEKYAVLKLQPPYVELKGFNKY